MSFKQKWFDIAKRKSTLLCVGLDPAEFSQRDNPEIPQGKNKLEWSVALIQKVAPYAAAIKPNRNYYKDFSRAEMQALTSAIHKNDMLAIDDCKLADIGETISAGLFHSAKEGFDAVTFAPFAGNTKKAGEEAKKWGIELITLVLMSNPEFKSTQSAIIEGTRASEYFAKEAQHAGVAGIVIGAPSSKNNISQKEVLTIQTLVPEHLVLMPGVGAQGGEMEWMLNTFKNRLMVNVGRAIFQAEDPAKVAALMAQKTAAYAVSEHPH